MANFSVTFSGALTENPLVINKPNSIQELISLLERCVSGQRRSPSDPLVVIGRTHASGTVTAAAVQSGDTFTINGQALTATQQYARGTVTAAGVLEGDTVTIQGVVLTARNLYAKGTATLASATAGDTVTVNGQVFTAAATENLATGQFTIAGNDTADAASLAACINASTDPRVWGKVAATSSAGVVTIRSLVPGVVGNTYTLTSSNGTRAAVTGSGFLSNSTVTVATSLAGDTVTVNGVVFTAGAGENLGIGQFNISSTDAAAATSLAAVINASWDPRVKDLITASANGAVVTIRSLRPLSGLPNAAPYTLTTSDNTTLAVGGARAVGDREFDMTGSNTETAASIVTAIATNSLLAALMTATNAAGVVTLRAVASGTAPNSYTLASSDGTRLAVSAANLAGGAAIANNQFDFGGTNTQTAASMAAAVQASSTAAIDNQVTASSDGAVVTVRAVPGGPAGNALTFVSSNGTRLAVSGSGTLLGGNTSANDIIFQF